MHSIFLAAAVAALAQAPAGAQAPAPAGPSVRTMTCPIGGGSFPFAAVAPPLVTGERPDGRPYGNVSFPLKLPECPDNGLVLYKDYDEGEVAKLKPLLASPAYQALRKETQYYRAYWLMREMGVGPDRYLWALLQASWEAEGRPELRNRYLAELAEASAKVPARPADLAWIGMEGRAINALRELGRFDEAMARLEKVPLKGLDAPAASAATPQAKVRRGWLAFFTKIKPAIQHRDSTLEPLDLLPRSIAFGRCIEQAGKLDEAGRAFCDKESTAVAAYRASRDKTTKEAEALRQSREASGR